jgi:hypothetical protein
VNELLVVEQLVSSLLSDSECLEDGVESCSVTESLEDPRSSTTWNGPQISLVCNVASVGRLQTRIRLGWCRFVLLHENELATDATQTLSALALQVSERHGRALMLLQNEVRRTRHLQWH